MSDRIQNLNNNEQMNRYARQTSLPEIGEAGQEKLRNAKVLIVGVGGLGSPIALYLAGAGVGTLGLVDDDQVSISNLQRQVLYAEADLGQPKPLCGARRVQGLNSDVNVEVYPFRLDKKNAGELIRNYDIVVDGCDNFAIVKSRKPLHYTIIENIGHEEPENICRCHDAVDRRNTCNGRQR